MQVVCEATQSESSDVQVAAFQCLVRIMQTYYDKMRLYMEKALFGVSKSYLLFDSELVIDKYLYIIVDRCWYE